LAGFFFFFFFFGGAFWKIGKGVVAYLLFWGGGFVFSFF
jgi:hypothetical protein